MTFGQCHVHVCVHVHVRVHVHVNTEDYLHVHVLLRIVGIVFVVFCTRSYGRIVLEQCRRQERARLFPDSYSSQCASLTPPLLLFFTQVSSHCP